MKNAIITAVKFLVLGTLASAVVLAIFVLLLAMPNILEWLSGYIGTTTTWILFLLVLGFIFYSFVTE